eukprot:GHVQ01032817.1.p2 GENE.GHVQ01032817.1~~GHVQ01032817.1.p2  ORF type:complete len:145 (+),score=17.31 GHVQ01032817.1:522-956(+)
MERWLHRVLIGLVFVVTAAIITRQANFLAPVTKDMLFQKHSVTALLVTAEELSNVLLMLRSKCPFFDFLACIFAATLLTLTFGLFFMRLRARREAAQANTGVYASSVRMRHCDAFRAANYFTEFCLYPRYRGVILCQQDDSGRI